MDLGVDGGQDWKLEGSQDGSDVSALNFLLTLVEFLVRMSSVFRFPR